jgi:hypothetical protein
LVLSAVLECGGQKVRNSPWVDPRIIPVFWRMIPFMGGEERFALGVVLELVTAASG